MVFAANGLLIEGELQKAYLLFMRANIEYALSHKTGH